jgi:retron-type reverse transcriptase
LNYSELIFVILYFPANSGWSYCTSRNLRKAIQPTGASWKRKYLSSKRESSKLRNVVTSKHWSRLQKTLMRSWSAKMLALRKVTQDNTGKKTAGVDGVKSLAPKQRLKLVNNLSIKQKVRPTRRVWIPKPGTEEKRPLGIPTMHDRALQALVKLALEPEWEARFEPNSYGFRLLSLIP